MSCTWKIKPVWGKYYRLVDSISKSRGTYRSSVCFGKLKAPYVIRSTKLRGILWIWSQLNMTKSYLKTRSVLSVIRTRRSFSLFQWSTLKISEEVIHWLWHHSFQLTPFPLLLLLIVAFSRIKHIMLEIFANLQGRWRMSQKWFYSVYSDNDSTVGSAVKFYVLISLGQTDRYSTYTPAVSVGHLKLLQNTC